MSYFLFPQTLSVGQSITITGEEARHILLSRRMKKGERLNLQGTDEKRYAVEITNVGKRDLSIKVLEQIQTPSEPENSITLLQAVVNEKALDFIFQKGTELGACKIVLFNSVNVAGKLTNDQFCKKLPRWQKILQEAAKQCDRIHPPILEFVDDINHLCQISSNHDTLVLLDPSGQRFPQSKISNQKSKIAIIIGPEGGFTIEEVNKFKALPNCIPLSLGPILLRAETAAIAGLSILRNL